MSDDAELTDVVLLTVDFDDLIALLFSSAVVVVVSSSSSGIFDSVGKRRLLTPPPVAAESSRCGELKKLLDVLTRSTTVELVLVVLPPLFDSLIELLLVASLPTCPILLLLGAVLLAVVAAAAYTRSVS